jgi:hypothetical protein
LCCNRFPPLPEHEKPWEEIGPVIVRTTKEGTRVLEPDDFKSLHLQTDGSEQAAAAIARLGRLVDPDHVFVPAQTLVTLAAPASAAPAWRTGFDAMIAYADKHGWVDDEGAVRMHIERTG